eukprot:gene12046-5442_t
MKTNEFILKYIEQQKFNTNNEREIKLYEVISNSLKEYKNEVTDVEELKRIKGIGPKIATEIAIHLKNVGITIRQSPRKKTPSPKFATPPPKRPDSSLTPKTSPNKRQKKNEDYWPEYQSASWAILVTMFKESENPLNAIHSSDELKKKGQRYCRSDMYKRFYKKKQLSLGTFQSIDMLITKNLVNKVGLDTYQLTSEGYEKAKELLDVESRMFPDDDHLFTSQSSPSSPKTPPRSYQNIDEDELLSTPLAQQIFSTTQNFSFSQNTPKTQTEKEFREEL